MSNQPSRSLASAGSAVAAAGVASRPTNPNAMQSNPHYALAQQTIDHVASKSTAGAFHPNELYASFDRDRHGKIIDAVMSDIGQHKKTLLESMRKEASDQHDTQLQNFAATGVQLTSKGETAQLAKHFIAVLNAKSETLSPQDLPTNCFEKALLGFDFAASQPENPRLDVVGFERSLPRTVRDKETDEPVHLPRGPDHTVLVMGLAAGSDITAPQTWDSNTMICDPSKQIIYPIGALFDPAQQIVFGSADAPFRFEPVISLPPNTEYDPNPEVVHNQAEDEPSAATHEFVQLGQVQENANTQWQDSDDDDNFF